MSWLQSLINTYDSNIDKVGEECKTRNGKRYTLLPVSHTTQNAHIEITITANGEFHSAKVLEKENTVIPSTESSASRAGKVIAPYPLHDKLSYCAGDLINYGGDVKEKNQFEAYLDQLKGWAESENFHDKILAIYQYVSKKRMIQDLIANNILFTEDDTLIHKWHKNLEKRFDEKPEIFKVIASDVSAAFVRFDVRTQNPNEKCIWEDTSVYDSFINYYNTLLHEADLCYVSGEIIPSTNRHANKIRHAADKAKIISSNDTSGYTFRGRFDKSEEAVSIGYVTSQKAHNALKWLINKQGDIIDDRVFLVWGNESVEIHSPVEDLVSINPTFAKEAKIEVDSLPSYASELSKAIRGYKSDLSHASNVNILVLDSATTGRLSVLYFRSMDKELYLRKIIDWHLTCCWLHRYRKDDQGKTIAFYGAPSTKDIGMAAYGSHANKKVLKGLMSRVLPCIIDGRKIPTDIIRSAISRASNPVSMERWEWLKTLSITCALINRQEETGVSLNHDIKDRNYLFGRLLAVAHTIESWAIREQGGGNRATNAERYMMSFSNKPLQTWRNIHASLMPYKARLGFKATKLNQLILDITDMFEYEEFNDQPLNGKYLLGFSSQLNDLDNRNKKAEEN